MCHIKTYIRYILFNNNIQEGNTQRTIQVVTPAVIANKRITTPVTLEVRPNKGSYNLNNDQAHRNIYSTMKRNDTALKIITSQNKIIDKFLQLPTENSYTIMFIDIIKCPKRPVFTYTTK